MTMCAYCQQGSACHACHWRREDERHGGKIPPKGEIFHASDEVLKLSLFLIAILGVLIAWGYNTSTILAGLGVGGLAIALAAQKTIENLKRSWAARQSGTFDSLGQGNPHLLPHAQFERIEHGVFLPN